VSLVRHSDAFTIEALYPNFHLAAGVSYSVESVMEGLASQNVRVGATVMAKHRNVQGTYVHPVMNRYLYGLLNRHIRNPMRWVFRSARRRLHAGDIAYFWVESPVHMCEFFRARRIMVVREMINCTLQLRRRELRKAYAALGETDRSGITDEMIERERRELLATDAVFCPNPFVTSSVLDYGFPPEHCIETSYGWSADRLSTTGRVVPEAATFTAAFVGSIDVRKGVPLLLEAWVRSKVKGRLLLAGRMTAEVEGRYAEILNRPDIIQLGYVQDVGAVYRAADVFCFPTWEEGGPQVTLEAMSVGSVPIVTPMGTAGAFAATDDVGIVVPAGSVDALSEALCALASDKSRLNHLKEQAKARAAEYTWDLVGQRRRAALIQHRDAWQLGVRG
jgi:glycosyltransferase involved in cell wall biosynthesis